MEPMTKRKVAELYWSSIRLYQIFHAKGPYPRQHVGHHSKRNHAKDMSNIIAKSMRAIYNCCQASLGGGGGQGKGRKRLNICLGKWQRRWCIWILFAVILYPWTKWGNKIVFFVLFKMRSDGFLVKWKWGGYHFLQPNFQWSTHWQANSKTTATATATPPPSSLSPWAAPVKMVFIIALTIIINMIIPNIIICAKNRWHPLVQRTMQQYSGHNL